MSDHGDRDDLQDLIHGFLPDEQAETLQGHLADCPECRELRSALEGEGEAVIGALGTPPLGKEEMDRIVVDILDSPAGGLVGPRSRRKKVRNPLREAVYRAVPIGVLSGIFAFLLFMIAYEQWFRPPGPSYAGQDPEPRGGATTSEIRTRVTDLLRGSPEKQREAKRAILEAGTSALRVLYEERWNHPWPEFERLTDLMFTLRFQGVTDERILEARDLLARENCFAWVPLGRVKRHHPDGWTDDDNRPDFHDSWRNIGIVVDKLGSLGLVYDTSAFPEPARENVPEIGAGGSSGSWSWKSYLALEYFTANLGLDYAFRYGALVISVPERLWPYPDDDRRPLDEKETARLFARLDDDDIGRREEARQRLLAGGREVLKFLDERKGGSEEAENNRILVVRALRARYGGFAFGDTCGLARQDLNEAGRALRESVASSKIGQVVVFRHDRLDAVLRTLSKMSGLPVRLSDMIADLKVAVAVGNCSLQEALQLLAKIHGLDFCIRDGAVWVDSAKNIAALVGK